MNHHSLSVQTLLIRIVHVTALDLSHLLLNIVLKKVILKACNHGRCFIAKIRTKTTRCAFGGMLEQREFRSVCTDGL